MWVFTFYSFNGDSPIGDEMLEIRLGKREKEEKEEKEQKKVSIYPQCVCLSCRKKKKGTVIGSLTG